MIEYRFFRVDDADQVQGQPEIISCADDKSARVQARELVDCCAIGATRAFSFMIDYQLANPAYRSSGVRHCSYEGVGTGSTGTLLISPN